MPGIEKAGVLRVAGEDNLFSHYTDEQGKHGFEYELIKAYADNQKLKLIYTIKTNLNDGLEMLLNDQCDVMIGPIPITLELKKEVDFTDYFLESHLVLIQRKNSKIRPTQVVRNMIGLGGKKIHTTNNKAQITRLHHLSSEISDTINIRILEHSSNERLISLVASGLINYAVCDYNIAKSFLERYPNIDIETPVGFNQYQGWAIKPGKELLLTSLNEFIANYKKSAEFAELKAKYGIH